MFILHSQFKALDMGIQTQTTLCLACIWSIVFQRFYVNGILIWNIFFPTEDQAFLCSSGFNDLLTHETIYWSNGFVLDKVSFCLCNLSIHRGSLNGSQHLLQNPPSTWKAFTESWKVRVIVKLRCKYFNYFKSSGIDNQHGSVTTQV